MSNVVPLFKQEAIDNHPTDDSNNSLPIAIADILASCMQLSHAVRGLSKCFGAVDHVIDGLGEAESKNRLDQSSKALAAAMHELSQAIKQLPRLQIDAMANL